MSWSCQACTYVNAPARTTCEICGTPKPANTTASTTTHTQGTTTSLPTLQSNTTVSTNSEWPCAACTFMNSAVNSKCAVCGTVKPAAPPSLPTQPPPTKPVSTQATVPTSAPKPATQPVPTQPAQAKPSPVPSPEPVQPAPAPTPSIALPGKGNVLGVSTAGQPVDFATALPASINRPSTTHAAQQSQPMQIDKPVTTKPTQPIDTSKIDTTAIEQQRREQAAKAEQQRIELLRQEVEKQKLADAEQQAELQQRRKIRAQQESQLTTIDNTIQYIVQNNEPTRVTQIFNMVIKLLSNIVKQPQNDKYRTIKTISPTIERLIMQPIGPSVLLRLIGFVSQQKPHSAQDKLQLSEYDHSTTHEVFVLPESANLNTVQQLLQKLQSLQQSTVTQIPTVFNELLQQHSANDIYYTAVELRNTFDNILSLPDESDYRKIDLETDTYKLLFAPYNTIQQLLQQFGWQRQGEHSPFLINNTTDLRLLDQGVVDLAKIINTLRKQTNLYNTVQYIASNNDLEKKSVSFVEFIRSFNDILDLIIQYPLESKYRKINLAKYFNKLGFKIKGGVRIFTEFGFTIDKANDTATLPDTASLELIKMMRLELDDLISAYIQ